MKSQEILIETQKIGHSLRVTAIDVTTLTEVVFQAPLSASPGQIKHLAQSKINYLLKRGSTS